MADTDERLFGTDGDDTIDAEGGSDTILGDAGDDTLTGGTGRDIIRGGSGTDTIYGGADGDILRGDSGDDTIYGDAGNDMLVGDSGVDTIYGGADNDTIAGGSGNDNLTGGTGADTFVFIENSGDDTITDFVVGNDTINLSMIQQAIAYSDLTITQVGSDTTITHTALGGTITLTGVTATELTADDFNLPDGSTTSLTAEENDRLERYRNPWEGTDSSDIYLNGESATEILAKGGNDVIMAGEGDDDIDGGAGDDLLMGEEGDDTIDGGADDDTLWGGSGDDTFVFQAGHGNDTIKDFKDVTGGENDTIDLTAFTGITAFSQLTITQDGDDTKIDLSSQGGGEIIIEDFTSTDLDATDFDFYTM